MHLGFPLAQSSKNQKILVIKVVRYDSQLISAPFMGVLTHCVASGELLTEATAVTLKVLGKAQPGYIYSFLKPYPSFYPQSWCLARPTFTNKVLGAELRICGATTRMCTKWVHLIQL